MSDGWLADALCRGMGSGLFYPTRGEDVRPAKLVCSDCPVRGECGTAGLFEAHGVWGGMSERQRDRVRGRIKSGDRMRRRQQQGAA